MLSEGNQIHNFISSSGSGTVINYGSGSGTVINYSSGSDFLTSYGSGSGSKRQKVTVPTVPVPVPVPQHCLHCNTKSYPPPPIPVLSHKKPVFRIRDVLIRILLFSSVAFKVSIKIFFFQFFAFNFVQLHLHQS
jgi:hypothetical protein